MPPLRLVFMGSADFSVPVLDALIAAGHREMDHLDGILFVDRISSLKRNMILRKLSKSKKMAAAPA